MICGFGRTGRWFGCEHWGVVPDVVTMGKGLGAGFPVSGLASTSEITKATPWGAPSGSSSSYGGNPMAGAAILAAVTVIEEERLVENAETCRRLHAAPLPGAPGEVRVHRGRARQGAADRRGARQGPRDPGAAREGRLRAVVPGSASGAGSISMVYSPSFRVNPPLTIDEGTADVALGILDEVFGELAREGGWR